MPGVRLLPLSGDVMNSFLEAAKYGCWVVGVAGLVAAYGLYSYPAHLNLSVLLAVAGGSAVLIVIGFVVRSRQRPKFQ
jgi:hypothetical protein